MACTVYDIARKAGVSRTTVLRALSDRPDVSEGTKAKIKQIAAEMKYRPNYIARSLTLGRSNLVGVIANPSLYYSFNSIIEGIERKLRENGYSMLLYISGRGSAGEESFVEQMMRNRVDGVIAVPSSRTVDPGAYQELIDTGVKLVTIDACIEGLRAPQVLADNYCAGRIATEHLISLGHRRIVYLGIPQVSYVGRERARGFMDSMDEAGIPIDDTSIVETEFDEQLVVETVRKILQRPERPTALLVRHDIVARGVMRAVLGSGLKIPEDISVMGCGNVNGTDMYRVPLSTVHFPAAEMATQCVRMLLSMLEGNEVEPEITMLDVYLIPRESTAPPGN